MVKGMSTARSIGLDICERVSKKGLRFIEEHDPDLYYDIMQRKKKGR